MKHRIITEPGNWLYNSRFWILMVAVVGSIDMAGLAQLTLDSAGPQNIRLSQWYGFSSLGLLYMALLISPLMRVVPRLQGANWLRHARRAIGVSAAYYALLHSLVEFTGPLGGVGGVSYYTSTYRWSLGLGLLAMVILTILAATSFDRVIQRMGFPRWKSLQRLVYIAGVAVVVHMVLIGTHYAGWTLLAVGTASSVTVLLGLEVGRMTKKNTES